MTKAAWDLDAVVAGFSAAATDPSKWVDAMEIASHQVGGTGALLVPVNGRLPIIPFSPSLAPSFEAYVRDGWIHRDERYAALPAATVRGVASDMDFTTPEGMSSSAYYQEFLAPFDLQWSAIVKVAAGDDLWVVSLQRSISQGPFQKCELNKLAALSGRLSGAAALARTLGFARAEAALAAFEISHNPAIMLDQFGCVLRLNQAAASVLGPDLFICQRRLHATLKHEKDALEKAIHRMLWDAGPAMLPPLTITRAEGRPLLLFLSRPMGI